MCSYDQIAVWHIANRQEKIGLQEVATFASLLPPNGKILDLGCGHGIPISKYLIEHGFNVYAIDSSAKLIAQFKENFPGIPTETAQIQDSIFFDTTFHAVIAWGVLFHLSAEDQEKVFHKVAHALHTGGLFFFTAQKEAINDTCTMAGITFPYISLGSTKYTAMLLHAGMEWREEYSDPFDNYVYIFKKTG